MVKLGLVWLGVLRGNMWVVRCGGVWWCGVVKYLTVSSPPVDKA